MNNDNVSNQLSKLIYNLITSDDQNLEHHQQELIKFLLGIRNKINHK